MTVGDTAPIFTRGEGDVPDETFRLIVDGTAAPFVLIDRLGDVRYVSGSIGRVVGWEPAALVGRNIVDFLRDDQIGLAAEAITEIYEGDRTAARVPMVFALRRPEGGSTWVEVGAMPLIDVSGLDVIALRLRPWDAEHHLGEFLAALLAEPSLDAVLGPLVRSIAASTEGIGAAVHHGFDGSSFVGAVPSWEAEAGLPVTGGPWLDVVGREDTVWLAGDAIPDGPRGAVSCWVVPVPGSDDVLPGVLSVWRDRPGPPLLGHRRALLRAASYVSLALLRTAEHQRLQHLAGHDALTGVANRMSFRTRLAAAVVTGERNLAVAFCDLDGFKPVNDSYGHRIGDDVLVEMTARLRSRLRVGDELARIGGDEFTVLMRNVPDATVAGQVADRLLLAIEEPFPVPGGEVRVGMSVGVALATRGATVDDLLSAADAALYACKRAGGGRRAVVG